MSSNCKNEEGKTNKSSREITAEELNQVAGGMGPVFLSLMPYPKPSVFDTIGQAIGPALEGIKPPPI
jgi:hypothetical protein